MSAKATTSSTATDDTTEDTTEDTALATVPQAAVDTIPDEPAVHPTGLPYIDGETLTAQFAVIATASGVAGVRMNIEAASTMGDGLSWKDLQKIANPVGSETQWKLPTFQGVKIVDSFDGFILSALAPHALWDGPYNPRATGRKPLCSSVDGQYGTGKYGIGSELHPAGTCSDCPMAQFTRKVVNGREVTEKPQCDRRVRVLVLLPNSQYPTELNISAGSLAAWKAYVKKLTMAGLLPSQVLTRFRVETLTKESLRYPVLSLEVLGVLHRADAVNIAAYQMNVVPTFLIPTRGDLAAASAAAVAAAADRPAATQTSAEDEAF